MGFPGHFKITGHSGTEFKHRKAFDKIKTYRRQSDKKDSTNESSDFIPPILSSAPIDYQQKYVRDRKMRILFKLPLLMISVILLGIVVVKSTNYYKDSLNNKYHQSLIDFTSYKTSKALKNRTFFNNSGYYHLRIGDLYTAQQEFTRALHKDEYDIDARIGLTETLIERCIRNNEVCKEALTNIAFLDDMDYLTKEGIWALSDKLYYANKLADF